MQDNDHRELLYSRGYCYMVIAFSLICTIMLFTTNFAWWIDESITFVRLSSTFRLSILIILPQVFAYLGTGIIAGLVNFTNIGDKEIWNRVIFWIALGTFGINILAAMSLLVAFSIISTAWSYGAGFISSLLGSTLISILSFLYFKIKQEIRS